MGEAEVKEVRGVAFVFPPPGVVIGKGKIGYLHTAPTASTAPTSIDSVEGVTIVTAVTGLSQQNICFLNTYTYPEVKPCLKT